MKTWLQLEEMAVLLFSIYLFAQLPFAWWWYPLLFFSPDLSMVFMAAGKRLGRLAYNLIHHRALALGLFVLGAWLAFPALSLAGVILLGHASLDRLLGFGLMEGESFTHAHLKLTVARVRPVS
jgi:hypothetical protein